MVGGVAFAVDFGSLVALTEFGGLYYLYSTILAFSVGMLVNYALSVRWVFHNRRLGNRGAELSIFFMVGVVGLGLTALLMWLFTDGAELHYAVSKLFTAMLVLLWNFGARKVILFPSEG